MTCLITLLGIVIAQEIEDLRIRYIPQVPHEIICEWIMTESSGNPKAISYTGDRGLLQISQRYEEYFLEQYWRRSTTFNVFEPRSNALIAFQYLSDLYEDHKNWEDAFANYNAGTRLHFGRKYAQKIMKHWPPKPQPIQFKKDCNAEKHIKVAKTITDKTIPRKITGKRKENT